MLDRSNGKSLRTAFLRHAAHRPDAPAVVARAVTRSYGEIEETARKWAAAIHNVALSRPERIGIFGYRSDTAYTGAMAALCSGAAFVPLNFTFPPEKNAAMIERAGLQAIIVDKTCAPHVASVLGGVSAPPPLLFPDCPCPALPGFDGRIVDAETIRSTAPLQQLPPLTPDDIAYLLFTSGSTGKPKGVPVTHGNAVYFMDVMSERYGIRAEDRFSQTFDQTFDLSVFDLFMAWGNGACLYAMTPLELLAPTRFINKHELTVWFSVPSLPAQMIRRGTLTPNSLPTLRWSLFCGEPLPARTAQMWQEAAPNSVVENLYGPTELTIACFVHRWDRDHSPAMCRSDLVPIGVPYPGLAALVVNDELKAVGNGESGELCVCGPQTTPGYWSDPEKTAERYVQLPVSPWETRRFYRTGDLVARSESGDYVFLGRVDFQVKVLGHRLELGEIEAVLRRDARVEHVVACGWPVVDGSAEGIVCFVSGNALEIPSLLEAAKAALPPYAVPSQIVTVSEMPLNPNGKIDRRALMERLHSAGAGA